MDANEKWWMDGCVGKGSFGDARQGTWMGGGGVGSGATMSTTQPIPADD